MDCKKTDDSSSLDLNAKQKVVLVGNPNVGKSVLFGLLTGTYATVSNYPGTTVEVSRGPAKVRGKSIHIIDSPGVNGLLPTSEDEQVTRDILLAEDGAVVLNVLDSKNLRRALLVTTQLAEAKKPVLLSLNMYDEAGEKGIKIDHQRLSKELGCTVVPTIATQRWGFDKLKDSFFTASVPNIELKYPPEIEGGLLAITALIPESGLSKRSMALMLLSGDSTLDLWQKENLEPEAIKQIKAIRLKAEGVYSEPIGYIINKERHRFVDNLVRKIITVEPKARGPVSEFIGKWAMHPVGGLFILAAVLFVMYEFVGVLGAGIAVDLLETHVFGEYLNPWATRMANATLPGGWAGELARDLLVGEYGLITMALTYAVAIILPIVGFFFIFFGLLEDSGYLPRLAVMVDRVFKLMGLNGKAVLPMILGLGCATMATMTTRMLETKKERIIVTLLLALGIPCSAQLGVILGMLGSISLVATLWWVGTVLLTLFIVAWLSSKIV
ncbi:MAG: ferrous iron transport protein B, partial [Deltaproteobacteria bacterium]|nr:ferrous iron transport protein B [Deltaproteobacteria bacterium]